MSKIASMIADQCPDGVEVRPLGEVGLFLRGSGLQKKDFVDEGTPCIHYGQIYTYYKTAASMAKSHVPSSLAATLKKAENGDLIITTTSENMEDVCTAIAWIGEGEVAIGGHSCVYKHQFDPLYLAYFFQSEYFNAQKMKHITGTKVKEIKVSDIARILVPIPPIRVQAEIAHTLSQLESTNAELERSLKEEVQSRLVQWEFERDLLITGTPETTWTTMGEVGTFFRGRRFTKKDLVADGLPAMHYGEIYTHYGAFADRAVSHVRPELSSSLRFADPGDLIIVAVGETVEDVGKATAWLGTDRIAVHDDCFVMRHGLNPKFVSYYFQTANFHRDLAKYVSRAKVKRISSESLSRLRLPLPAHGEQERVVAVVEKLEALTLALVANLPEEIGTRRQQFEYHLNKLFSFKEAA